MEIKKWQTNITCPINIIHKSLRSDNGNWNLLKIDMQNICWFEIDKTYCEDFK